MKPTAPPAGVNPRGFWLYTVLTVAMALPMLILYVTGALGPYIVQTFAIPAGSLGYVTMCTFGLAALLSPWAGAAVERLGPRLGLRLLFGSVTLAYVLMLWLPGFTGLLLAVAFCGVAQALSNPVTNLLIAQRIEPAQRPFAVGLKQSGVQMSALYAGLVLAAVANQFGWHAAIGSVIPLALLFAAAGPRVAPGSHSNPSRSLRLARPHAWLLWLMAVQLCSGIALSAFVTYLPLYATHIGLSAPQAGLMMAAFGGAGVLSRLVLTAFASRMRDESNLLTAVLLTASACVAVPMAACSYVPGMLWVSPVCVGLTVVATNAVAMGMLLRDPTFGAPASSAGFLSCAFFGGFAVGAPVFGFLLSVSHGFSLPWALVVTVLLSGALAAFVLSIRRRDTADRLKPA